MVDPIAAFGAVTFIVDDPSVLARGVLQVDDELMYASVINPQTASVTVPAYGRGYGGSTASAHDPDAMVVNNPIFPRHQVKNSIN